MQQVRPELGRVGAITLNMLRDVLPARKDSKKEGLWDIARCGDQVDILETEILNYLARIRSGSLTDQESIEFQGLMTAIDNFENLADVIETEVVSLAHQVVRLESFSGDKTRRMLAEFHATVTQSVELAMVAVRDNDQLAAESVLLLKNDVRAQSERLLTRKAERLNADDPDYLARMRLEMSFVDQMRRIYTLSKRIAKDVRPAAIARRD